MKASALLFLGLVLLEGAAIAEQQAAPKAEAEKAKLRERLRQQFNLILETRDTARGLIVSIDDVLFDTDKSTLKPAAREKLAKVAGILLAYPGLKVQLESHGDSVSSDEANLKLSEQRSYAVRDYLVAQGVSGATAHAKVDAPASNDTAPGKQQNGRVVMVVSGEPIETGGAMHTSTHQ